MAERRLTIDDNSRMGLDNTVCEDIKYYCKSKRVYLSEEDVKRKRCLCKPTFDMIGVRRCAWLEDVKVG